jgi:hypothetical protein
LRALEHDIMGCALMTRTKDLRRYARHGNATELQRLLAYHPWLSRHTNLLGGLGADLTSVGRHPRWGSGAFQARNWYGCATMLEAAERRRGSVFTFVGIGRPDLVWRAHHVPTRLLDAHGARCYVPTVKFQLQNATWMNDDYAVCNRAGSAVYLDAVRYYNTAVWREGLLLDAVTQAEQFLAWRLARANVVPHRLPPVAFAGCDCAGRCSARMTNMWNHVCTYSTELSAGTFSEYTGFGARVVAESCSVVRERGWQPHMVGAG